MKYKSDAEKEGKVLQFPDRGLPPKEEEPTQPTFAMFAFAIVGGQVEIAGKILGAILNLESQDALKAAKHYHDKYLVQKDIQSKAMHIRILIQAGQNTDALMAIYECFGLQGPPAIAALESMRQIADS